MGDDDDSFDGLVEGAVYSKIGNLNQLEVAPIGIDLEEIVDKPRRFLHISDGAAHFVAALEELLADVRSDKASRTSHKNPGALGHADGLVMTC